MWATAAVLEDVETCVAALEVPATWPAEVPGRRVGNGEAGMNVFNPLSWPLELWEAGMPAKYVWALCQAYSKATDNQGKTVILTLVEMFKAAVADGADDAVV